MGFHSLSTADVDNDGFDEIIAGSLTLDNDGTILYAMDGEMGREQGSHGDALHVGAFDPAKEGLQVMAVHEVPAVPSVELHDAATGETLMSFHAYMDTGRGLAANITASPGFEFWGTGGTTAASGGGIYNVQGGTVANSFRSAGLSVNFALHWDGDLLNELLDHTSITKYDEQSSASRTVKSFEGAVSNNGTKATPSLQADILGDWREEVLLPAADSSELRIYGTTVPTEYRIYTLMHDPVYRNAVAWQNTAYNQPPHLGFYLGEDIRAKVLEGELQAPNVMYANKQPAGTKSFLTGPSQARKGEPFVLGFGLADVNPGGSPSVQNAVYAMDLTFGYDPAVVEFVEAGSLRNGLTIAASRTDPAGKVRIILASQGAEGAVMEDGDILRLTWKVKSEASAGSTGIAAERAVLANGSGGKREAAGALHTVVVRKADRLQGLIGGFQALYDQAVEGFGVGQYYPGSKARFFAALGEAKHVAADPQATDEMLNAAYTALEQAIQTFLAATGDLDGRDGVDIADLGLIAPLFGTDRSSARWSEAAYLDMDGNGRIGIEELSYTAKKILAR